MADIAAEPQTLARVILHPAQEKRLLAGHNWVFSNEIKEVRAEGEPKPGDLAVIVTSTGHELGLCFYHPNSLIAGRMLTRSPREVIDAEFFRKRLADAMAYRERVCPGENAYRLCFGESDGLPGLVVDRYGSILVLQVLSAGIERRLDMVAAALDELLKPKGIYLKNDHRARSLEGLPLECRVLAGSVPEKTPIVEGGLRFAAAIGEGQKTGHYFDQRDNRAFLRPYCAGRNVLDLYCYTGGFAINAAKGGAKSVFALDSSGPALALAKENAKLNGVEGAVSFDEGDAEAALESFAGSSQPFKPDMIVLDPPSLVPAKKHLPKALRLYAKLNAQAMKALPRGGLLATATCSHHVSREEFVKMLRDAQTKAQRGIRLIALRGQSADHPVLLAMPETEYLHFALLEIL
ncbi:MAG TPA: class I SAM-dependent rRNA methyltransferase [Elusimicrobiota bacterium]|jgi:23S rRNA (cytosine1962-C5)-methyltransferase|nr:class I SAM-dependent rRNA methyltransferase [Elusimicrobiota bacterium]